MVGFEVNTETEGSKGLMGNIGDFLKRYIRVKANKEDYARKVYNLIGDMRDKLEEYYRVMDDTGIVVQSEEELDKYFDIYKVFPKYPADFRNMIYNRYYNIRYNYTDGEFKGVLMVNTTERYGNPEFLDVTNEAVYDSRVKDSEEIKYMKDILNSNLYKGYEDLLYLYGYLDNLIKNYGDRREINRIASQQDVVDYFVKIGRIGEKQNVFDVFVNKPEEWHGTFFKPLRTITDNIHLLRERGNEEDLSELELEQIVRWSSTQLYNIEEPKETVWLTDEVYEEDMFGK